MTDTIKKASFLKRLGAMFYDFMLVLSFVIVVGFFSMVVVMSLFSIENVEAGSLVAKLFFPYLLLLSFIFYGWFWTHGGQTLGMRAWKLQLITDKGSQVGWGQAFFRFCYSIISWIPLGAGYLWMLVDTEKKTWHDKISHTCIIDLK